MASDAIEKSVIFFFHDPPSHPAASALSSSNSLWPGIHFALGISWLQEFVIPARIGSDLILYSCGHLANFFGLQEALTVWKGCRWFQKRVCILSFACSWSLQANKVLPCLMISLERLVCFILSPLCYPPCFCRLIHILISFLFSFLSFLPFLPAIPSHLLPTPPPLLPFLLLPALSLG